jgi:hypothetical protein
MLNERVGVVLKNVMDGKGKRLEINVCPVLAAELQIILEGGEPQSLESYWTSSSGTLARGVWLRVWLLVARGLHETQGQDCRAVHVELRVGGGL